MPIFLLGAQLFAGTMFLCGVFVAALLTHNTLSWQLALVSEGFSYLCACAQLGLAYDRDFKFSRRIILTLWLITLFTGAAAGLLLL